MQSPHALPVSSVDQTKRSNPVLMLLFWLYVGIPLAWGVSSTAQKALALFH